MTMSKPVEGSAPGKAILVGEHAVVYGRPAIAVPVAEVRATVRVAPAAPGQGLTIAAPEIRRRFALAGAADNEPLAVAARLALHHAGAAEPDAVCTVRSGIPVASGMGSGAAVSAALIRALSAFLGQPLDNETLSGLVYEVERLYHGTPSGIDNTVVAYEQPIFFVRGQGAEPLIVGAPFTLLIADTGVRSATKTVVERVRRARERDAVRFDALFDQVSDIALQAREAIASGNIGALGPLLDENHDLLIEMGVSSPQLDDLVETARFAGALGAKLSGAGRGGCIIALVEDDLSAEVRDALREAGATRVIATTVA